MHCAISCFHHINKPPIPTCERINSLQPEQRDGLPWHYVLLGETLFRDWRSKGARMGELLEFARVRPVANASLQAGLF